MITFAPKFIGLIWWTPNVWVLNMQYIFVPLNCGLRKQGLRYFHTGSCNVEEHHHVQKTKQSECDAQG